jgi:hypothetical protein
MAQSRHHIDTPSTSGIRHNDQETNMIVQQTDQPSEVLINKGKYYRFHSYISTLETSSNTRFGYPVIIW